MRKRAALHQKSKCKMKYSPKQYAKALHLSLQGASGDEFSKRVKAFLSLLKRNRALKFLPRILREMEELETGRAAVICAARPVAERVAREVKTALGAARVNEKTMPELLGGMVIQWDDWRVDASVRGRIAKLRSSLR